MKETEHSQIKLKFHQQMETFCADSIRSLTQRDFSQIVTFVVSVHRLYKLSEFIQSVYIHYIRTYTCIHIIKQNKHIEIRFISMCLYIQGGTHRPTKSQTLKRNHTHAHNRTVFFSLRELESL